MHGLLFDSAKAELTDAVYEPVALLGEQQDVYYNKRIKYPLPREMLYTGKKRDRFLSEMGIGSKEQEEAETFTLEEGFVSPEDIIEQKDPTVPLGSDELDDEY